ncbi:hypothetical protein [Pandoraea sp. SD6-2]|uniref:hypothetical protein n=1 Tax=Pandoraea sp. SD6-2 TaxID=1286093 RepID=UPI00032F045B|nr:hypothetical protein [Pandoraea sp. SD6-2]EON15018.1 hypothetical protein C266_03163 [Pandoraea sp. SD6-2]
MLHMGYAIQNADGTFRIGTAAALWPNRMFSQDGPSSTFLEANTAYPVVDVVPTDAFTVQVSTAPQLIDGAVYTVQAQPVDLATAKSLQTGTHQRRV